MNEEKFWEIIEKAGSPANCDPEDQCENITEQLSSLNKEDLVAFANIHKEILVKAYTWEMIKACYVLLGYASDDVFEDFRNWVILNGKNRFYKTIQSPDEIASYLTVEDPVEEVTGEPLLYVCEEAWNGDIEELENEYLSPSEPEINETLPENSILIKEFPSIHNKYGTLSE